jgi:hypothetical protein
MTIPIEQQVKELPMGKDFCQYLGLCREDDVNVIKNLCLMKYQSCDRYQRYKDIDNQRRRGIINTEK